MDIRQPASQFVDTAREAIELLRSKRYVPRISELITEQAKRIFRAEAAFLAVKASFAAHLLRDEDPKRVMVVDDDDTLRGLLRMTLFEAGYGVHESAIGHEALVQLGEGCAVDVVIADYWLEDMTGSELAKRVRRLDPRVDVVFSTGDVEAAKTLVAAGERVLTKPYTIASLRVGIDACLESRRGSCPWDGRRRSSVKS